MIYTVNNQKCLSVEKATELLLIKLVSKAAYRHHPTASFKMIKYLYQET